ncbi:MAG: hypothetical protein ACR2NN_08910 [Bryobacteraceae bacterium]
MRWKCKDGDLLVDFNVDHPFAAPPTGPIQLRAIQGNRTRPVKIHNRATAKPYKYTVHVTPPGQPECTPLDPKIIIDDGSGKNQDDFVTARVLPTLAIGLGLALAVWGVTTWKRG